MHILSISFSKSSLLLTLSLGWQTWSVCSGKSRRQCLLYGKLAGLLVFPHCLQLYLNWHFLSFFFFFFLWWKKFFFSSHFSKYNLSSMKLQKGLFLFESSDSCVWNLKYLTSSFCPCLVPPAGHTGILPICSLCTYIFTHQISQEKKPFWILAFEEMEIWVCATSWQKATGGLLVFLFESFYYLLLSVLSLYHCTCMKRRHCFHYLLEKGCSGDRELLAHCH